MMPIPEKIYQYLNSAYEKGEAVPVERIVYKFKKSRSMAYAYLREFEHHNSLKRFGNQEDLYIAAGIKQAHRRNVSTEAFKEFMFNVLDDGGFKSTRHLFLLFIHEFICWQDAKNEIKAAIDHLLDKRKSSDPISLEMYTSRKRTFNRYFEKFREDQKDELKKHKLRISRSRVDGTRGFYTAKRKKKVPQDY